MCIFHRIHHWDHHRQIIQPVNNLLILNHHHRIISCCLARYRLLLNKNVFRGFLKNRNRKQWKTNIIKSPVVTESLMLLESNSWKHSNQFSSTNNSIEMVWRTLWGSFRNPSLFGSEHAYAHISSDIYTIFHLHACLSVCVLFFSRLLLWCMRHSNCSFVSLQSNLYMCI